MKIFLDDKRTPPSGFNLTRNYSDCITLLELFKDIDFISLDYDLGEEKTGMDVVKWIVENKVVPKAINVHSSHREGSARMIKYLRENMLKEVQITKNVIR